MLGIIAKGKKIIWLIIILVLFSWFLLSDKTVDMDSNNYEELKKLSMATKEDLIGMGYSLDEVQVIKNFTDSYNNYLMLLPKIKDNSIYDLGYDNKQINRSNNFKTETEVNNVTDENLKFDLYVQDIYFDIESNRTVARALLLFDCKKNSVINCEDTVNILFDGFMVKNMYTAITYKNRNDADDVIYGVSKVNNDFGRINISIPPTQANKKYLAKSGIIVVDIFSDTLGVKSDLVIQGEYLHKTLLKEKIISHKTLLVSY